MASACPVQPIAVQALGHPAFAPVETVTTDQTQIPQTRRAPVSKYCFQQSSLWHDYKWKKMALIFKFRQVRSSSHKTRNALTVWEMFSYSSPFELAFISQ